MSNDLRITVPPLPSPTGRSLRHLADDGRGASVVEGVVPDAPREPFGRLGLVLDPAPPAPFPKAKGDPGLPQPEPLAERPAVTQRGERRVAHRLKGRCHAGESRRRRVAARANTSQGITLEELAGHLVRHEAWLAVLVLVPRHRVPEGGRTARRPGVWQYPGGVGTATLRPLDHSAQSESGDRRRVVRRKQSHSPEGPRPAAGVTPRSPSNRLVESVLSSGGDGQGLASLGTGFVRNLQRTAGNAAVARRFEEDRLQRQIGNATPQVTVTHQADRVIFRYLDDFKADATDTTATTRRATFIGYIENAVTAGVPAAIAERAALTVLNHYGDWTHPAVGDFDWGYVNGPRGFKTELDKALKDVEEGARTALLKAIFSAVPGADQLKELGASAGFVAGGTEEVDVDLNPDDEPAFLDWAASWFETKGQWPNQGAVFRKVWATATPAHKNRILEVLLDRDEDQPTEVRLSDIDYLIESVTGFTPSSHKAVILEWFNSKTQDLFDYVLGTGKPGYKTKYMTAEEREEHRLEIRGNSIFMADSGDPLVGSNIFVFAKLAESLKHA